MHTWTITREARRIVRETQYVLIDAATEEEAIEAARATSDSVWLEQDFVESWTDSADDYAATLEECGCDECCPPECSQCCAPLIVPGGATAHYGAKCVDCAGDDEV